MTAGSRQLERPPGALLTENVGQVRQGRLGRQAVAAAVRRWVALPAEVRDRLCEVGHGDDLDRRELGLGSRLGRAHEPLEALGPRPLGHGEHASDRPDPSVERQLTERGVLDDSFTRDLS